MEGRKQFQCYVTKGGQLRSIGNGESEYVGGLSKGLVTNDGMTYDEFVVSVCQRWNMSTEGIKLYYTVKFNSKMYLQLEDETDFNHLVMNSDEVPNVYIVHPSTNGDVAVAVLPNEEANRCITNIRSTPNNASNALCENSMQARGFASRCGDNDNMPLQSERFHNAILGSGHTFKTAEDFRNAIYLMSMAGRFKYKYERNSPKDMSVKCSIDGCRWKITAHAVDGTEIMRVHTYNVQHNHSVQDECSTQINVSSKRGALIFDQVLRSTPSYLPRQICKDFARDHGIEMTYNQAWRLKEKAKERIEGVPKDSYKLLPWLCEKVKEVNPGTIAEVTSLDGHFQQLFVAYGFSIQGFMMGCRPVLVVDSSHLSGPYQGALLSATAYDADDGMFPLAFGVVGSENYEDWYWFLEKIKGIVGEKEVVIISDRHPALLRSVSELFGLQNHAYCFRHLKENFSTQLSKCKFRGKKGKDDALQLLDAIAYAKMDYDYIIALQNLRCFNENLAKWVEDNNPEQWAMSKFGKKRWDKMTSNIAESFNAWMKDERHLSIPALVLWHMDKLVAMLNNHFIGVEKWASCVGPKTQEKLLSTLRNASSFAVAPYFRGIFKVYNGETIFEVNLMERECSCKAWQMSGLPCSHACAVIGSMRHDIYDYVDNWYMISTQKIIYSGSFRPVTMYDMPKIQADGTVLNAGGFSFPTLNPPIVKRKPGRPRIKRIESQVSHKRPLHCSRCHGIGHNRSTCTNPLS